MGREHSKPGKGDLGLPEELIMTALLYRDHSYKSQAASPKACIELTYRRERYNTCQEKSALIFDASILAIQQKLLRLLISSGVT